MKVVILAGGQQSTLSKNGEGIPKPMIEVGGRPLLWHIMKHFSQYGLNEFIICGGYKVDTIKEYFKDFYIYESDITVDLQKNTIEIHKKRTEDWKVTVVDTGINTDPANRIYAVSEYLQADADEDFLVVYGDCLSDVDMSELIKKHKAIGKLVTLVMAKPQGRKQLLTIDENDLLDYDNLSPVVADAAWVNADCFVMNKKALKYLNSNGDIELSIFRELARQGQIGTYRHEGYWTTIETWRDLVGAQKLWDNHQAPWFEK